MSFICDGLPVWGPSAIGGMVERRAEYAEYFDELLKKRKQGAGCVRFRKSYSGYSETFLIIEFLNRNFDLLEARNDFLALVIR